MHTLLLKLNNWWKVKVILKEISNIMFFFVVKGPAADATDSPQP
jgi:hypothetical protein